MSTYIFFLSFIFLTLIIDPTSAQQDFSNVEIKIIPVSGNIYMLEGQGGQYWSHSWR